MSDYNANKKQKIVDLIKDSAPTDSPAKPVRKRNPPAPKASIPAIPDPKQGTIYVNGNGNAVAGRDITQNITHHHKPARPKVVVKTADGVIDAQQKAELTRLRDEWLTTHNAVKQRKLTYQAAWGRFNRAMKVNGYAELKPEQFEAGCKWFRTEIAKINGMPSAAKKVPGHHNKRIGAIKARCKNQLGDEFAYVAYIIKNFNKSSLADLDIKEMEATYRYIMGKKKV